MNRKIRFVLLVLLFAGVAYAQVKREREEGITDLIASNTMGFGNIWVRSALSLESKSGSNGGIEPYVAAGLGLSQNLSAWGGAVPFDGGIKQLIGKADAHFKLTLPNNDNLRLFGLAVQGDLVLSTEQDTLSKGQDTSRPAFAPRVGMTVAADADLIKQYKWLPLKVYLNWSMFDNDRLLSLYKQQSIRLGVEYKGERNSYFLGIRYGLYKRITGDDSVDTKAAYDQSVITLLPGIRYRIMERFSVLGTLILAVGGNVQDTKRLSYTRYGFRTTLEFPLFFRETNSEAIRSMIFLENRQAVSQTAIAAMRKPKNDLGSLFTVDDGQSGKDLSKALKEDDLIQEREQQAKEKRKKVNEELNSIEQLLE